jgi:hypothetical protein
MRITLLPTWLAERALTSCDGGTESGTLARLAGRDTASAMEMQKATSAICQAWDEKGI